jgi:hypothetical protein
MPVIIDYPIVVETLKAQGMKALYYNSGTFGFVDEAATKYVGWIGAEDPTMRAAAREVARHVPAPYPQTLARMTRELWQRNSTGDIWFTPGSHWAFELEDGGNHFMPDLLGSVGIDADCLRDVNRAPAISFSPAESQVFESFLLAVFQHARFTDYGLILPNHPVVGLLHHHVQIWWRTTDPIWLAHLQKNL